MSTLKQKIIDIFQAAFAKAFPEADITVHLSQATKEAFGHYQCNSAMQLAKPLKMAPRQISEQVVQALNNLGDPQRALIDKVEIAGPGFMNIWLAPKELNHLCEQMSEQLLPAPDKQEKVIVDFSSPNIAKEMHVGHLRSTIIGDSICRLFEKLGHNVLRLNHIGDWGTAFGMLIAYLKQEVGTENLNQNSVSLTDLVGWYKASKKKFDEDEAFKKASQLEVVELQGGNQENVALWKMICAISQKAYQEIYNLLDVTIIDRGESYYNDDLPGIVKLLEDKGMVEVSDGAKCVFPAGYENRNGEPLPFMIQKSDGGYNYATTDLAAIRQRAQEEKGDRLIYVTDGGQATHFSMLFDVAKQAGLYDPAKTHCYHVPFGLVLGPDGKKFKTRSGETERLIDLLHTAIDKARDILIARQETQKEPFTEEQIEQLSELLGIDAVKYADLSCNRTNDYVFSYERMLKFEGNTAAFLLYSYVRICGIKRKINNAQALIESAAIELVQPAEIQLGLHLCRWHETLLATANELLPNRLCDYLFELAEKFNAFFRDCRVEGSDMQNQRLKLCELTSNVLASGLDILGLKTTERM